MIELQKVKRKTWTTTVLTDEERLVYRRRQSVYEKMSRRRDRALKAIGEMYALEDELRRIDREEMKPIRAAVRKRLQH